MTDWRQLLEPDVQEFMTRYCDYDVRELGLKRSPNASWCYPMILDQIKVRQKARTKSPDLYETDSIIFPESDVFEQASSSACAAYKASLVERGGRFVDLTAGSGIDAFYFSKRFDKGALVEREEQRAALLVHNASALCDAGFTGCDIRVEQGDAQEVLMALDEVDFAFIDPQRRENGRKGLYEFSLCSPDVVAMLPELRHKTRRVMVKASPMLDIERGILALESVVQVHVVQWRSECKEVLFLLDFERDVSPENVVITSVDLDDNGAAKKTFSYCTKNEKSIALEYADPKGYIYEPDPAFQKCGGFKSLAVQFGVAKLHQSSHLYTSDALKEDFPGKVYSVLDIVNVRAKDVPVSKAEMVLRNFPGSVQDLRKKLKVSDGGVHRIFATTLWDNSKKLIICTK